jgi:hypothetical protein
MAGLGFTLQRVAALCSLVLLATGMYWTLRIGYADYLAGQSPEGMVRARKLVPIRADYWSGLPAGAENRGENGLTSLQIAARLNPADAQPWIDMGLDAELSGDYPRAERDLLHATQINQQFEPRWTLANYYLRRHDDRFWYWIKQALLKSYDDRTALFRLCWMFTDDADVILSRGIPDENQFLAPYLSFLLSENRWSAAEACALRMLPRADDRDVPGLLHYCELLLQKGRVSPALTIWNSLSEKKLLPYPPVIPDRGNTLVNGEFRHEPFLGAFDWHLIEADGIRGQVLDGDGGLRISFSGKQPESCEVLTQFLALAPSRTYELRFEYRLSASAGSNAGLQWKLLEPSGSELPSRSPQLSSQEWKQEKVAFSSPPSTRAVRLALVYKRMPGTTRIEGAITLRKLALAFGS